eukprot:366245-Chlamydomonas_euryale.AAC.3
MWDASAASRPPLAHAGAPRAHSAAASAWSKGTMGLSAARAASLACVRIHCPRLCREAHPRTHNLLTSSLSCA